jgi:riboflavin biosynthesis pyrimidine reductase
VRQIYPVQGPDWPVTPKPAEGRLPDVVSELARLYGNRARAAASPRWLRANMVTSSDGAAALDGLSGGLSGPADRMLFKVLRSLADVILVGAGTARAERYRPVSAAGIWTALRPADAALPGIAVITASLDLDACPQLLAGQPGSPRPILITTEHAAAADAARGGAVTGRAQVIVAGRQRVDVRQAVRALGCMGYRQILAEGGPGLLGQLAEAGLVDEFCITISPVLAGGPAGRVVAARPSPPGGGAADRLKLAHVLADDDFLFCRYLRQDTAPSEE